MIQVEMKNIHSEQSYLRSKSGKFIFETNTESFDWILKLWFKVHFRHIRIYSFLIRSDTFGDEKYSLGAILLKVKNRELLRIYSTFTRSDTIGIKIFSLGVIDKLILNLNSSSANLFDQQGFFYWGIIQRMLMYN